jgi:transposase
VVTLLKPSEPRFLPNQMPNWLKPVYEWVYEEIYGADFSTLNKAMEEGTF